MGFRMRIAWMMAAVLAAVPAGAQQGGVTRDPDALIEQLASPDPRERDSAADALKNMGAAARPALTRAAESPDPAIAQQARALLRTLPWHEASDPQAVRMLLGNYRERSAEERAATVDSIASQLTSEAGVALVRILQQEPMEPVRWRASQALRNRGREDDRDLLRTLGIQTHNTALLAAIAWAWEPVDSAKAIDLYREVLRLESERPTQSISSGETDPLARFRRRRIAGMDEVIVLGPQRLEDLPLAPAVLRLQQVAIRNRDWALLGEAWRGFVRHLNEAPDWRDKATRELFSLHARFGPLPGLASDLRAHEATLRDAAGLYLLSEIAGRTGMPMLQGELLRAAFGQSHGQPIQRMEVANELLRHHWMDLAARELRAVLSEPAPAGLDPDVHRVLEVVSRLTLAAIAGDHGDDAAAASHLEHAIARGQGLPELAVRPLVPVSGVGIDVAREQMYWRQLRAARRAGHEAEVVRQLDVLVALWPKDADVLFDVTNELRARGRAEEAKRLFNAAAEPMRQRIGVPTTANEMNELAWIYARSGERLEEARGLAKRAVAMEPDNAAYLDTLAEAEFRLGNVEEAIRLEERALELAPGMPFMLNQLERFRAGLTGVEAGPQDPAAR